jgi:hypothetical protein
MKQSVRKRRAIAAWNRGVEARRGSAAWKRGVEARRGSAAWKRGVEARRGSAAWKRGVVSWTGIMISLVKAGRCSDYEVGENKKPGERISVRIV